MAFMEIGLRLGDPTGAAAVAEDQEQQLGEAAAAAAAAAAVVTDTIDSGDENEGDHDHDDGGGNEDKEGSSGGKPCHVYVGNLSWQTSWQDIKDHFRSAADGSSSDVVRADVAVGPDGRSKGYGLVVFKDTAAAERAIATCHDSELGGRLIVVRKDRSDEQSAGGTVSSPSVGGRRVYVNNLAWDVSWQDLKDHFRNASGTALNVLRADVLQVRELVGLLAISRSVGRSVGRSSVPCG